MNLDDFLDALCDSDLGKIICINLYRSLKVGTLTSTAVKEFLTLCATDFYNLSVTSSTNKADLALQVATKWTNRSALISKYKFAYPGTDRPAQFTTILPVEKITASAPAARHVTYGSRKISKQFELEALLEEWMSSSSPNFDFGKGKAYFWVARMIDTSLTDVARLPDGFAQICRDTLGLCHLGNSNTLVRAIIPAAHLTSYGALLRPTAFDGLDNPAFMSALPSEMNPPPLQPGTTLNLHFRADRSKYSGQNEWLCPPVTLPAAQVVWDFLGAPKEAAIAEDKNFHAQVRELYELTTDAQTARKLIETL